MLNLPIVLQCCSALFNHTAVLAMFGNETTLTCLRRQSTDFETENPLTSPSGQHALRTRNPGNTITVMDVFHCRTE